MWFGIQPLIVADYFLVFLKDLEVVGDHLPVQHGGTKSLLLYVGRHEQVVPESFGEPVQVRHD